jgi:hypothetical protein
MRLAIVEQAGKRRQVTRVGMKLLVWMAGVGGHRCVATAAR